jgi:hypothetical protein
LSVCTNCGKDNQPHYKFCVACASELPPDTGAVRPMAKAAFRSTLDEPKRAPKPKPSADDPWGVESTTAVGVVPRDDGPDLTPTVAPQSLQAMSAAARSAGATQPCPTCGNPVPTDFAFCGQCGTRLDEKQPAPRTLHGQQPSNMPGPRGQMVLVRPDGSEGGDHPLEEGENPIGRGFGALFEADGYLSPRHAELILNAAGLVVRDMSSLNGVYVRISDEEEIFDGDVFRIGQELLRFDAVHVPQPLDDGTDILGSPNPGYWGRLAVIVGRDQDGSAFPLFGESIALGRERGDILFPEDGYVSGAHAKVSMRDGQFFLTDLDSSNGTFVRIRGERMVPSGSYLLMGQQLFRVVYG